MENVKVSISGSVAIKKTGELVKLFPNHVMPGAKDIIRRALAGQDIIKYVEIYDGDNLKVKKALSSSIVVIATTNIVKFNFTLLPGDYNGSADNMKLLSDTNIVFSELTGVDLSKDNTQTINIEWTLTINLV